MSDINPYEELIYITRNINPVIDLETINGRDYLTDIVKCFLDRNGYNKLEAENAKLTAELAARDWQSADKLPEEEGEYAVEHLDGSRVFRDLELLKSELALLIVKKYLKLPDVEEK